MNTAKGLRRQSAKGAKLSFQTPTATEEEEKEEEEGPKVVRETAFGRILQGFFAIKVKDDTGKKVLYENKKEPFEYPEVDALANAIVHAGAKLTDAEIDAIGSAIPESAGPQVKRLTKVYNDRLRADAKSSAYQSLVSKHKPLEGEDKLVAIAKTIRNILKFAPFLTAETVIETLKTQKAVPVDYTVEDYNGTQLRKPKGTVEEDDED